MARAQIKHFERRLIDRGIIKQPLKTGLLSVKAKHSYLAVRSNSGCAEGSIEGRR